MKSVLTALQEGRLIELPVTTKEKAIEYLAILIEAVPKIGTSLDLVGMALAREKEASTALGMQVACPHVRVEHEGELISALGWSPSGIDYGALDGQKVHLVILYYIPSSQRNAYLKEISSLAKAVQATHGITAITAARDLQEVRRQLLDWVSLAIESAVPDARARMIQLQARVAAGAGPALPALEMTPFTIVVLESGKPVPLSQKADLVGVLEADPGLGEALRQGADFEIGPYRVLLRSSSAFAANRVQYECLAVKIGGVNRATAAPEPGPAR